MKAVTRLSDQQSVGIQKKFHFFFAYFFYLNSSFVFAGDGIKVIWMGLAKKRGGSMNHWTFSFVSFFAHLHLVIYDF